MFSRLLGKFFGRPPGQKQSNKVEQQKKNQESFTLGALGLSFCSQKNYPMRLAFRDRSIPEAS